MKIYYHPQFFKSYKLLDKDIKRKAEIKEKIFRENPFNFSLKTHKLKGELKNQRSFYIDNQYRILFEFNNSDVIFLDIGTHKIYK